MHLHHARTFDDVLADVREHASHQLPDRVVRLADLRMTPEGHLESADMRPHRLNDWSRGQLASRLGIRWGKWFEKASPTEVSDEVNRRLSRAPEPVKLRASRASSASPDDPPVLRAIVGPTFTAIDDARIFERLTGMLAGVFAAFRFLATERTESTTRYTAVHTDAVGLDGDDHLPGFTLRNSEVAACALSIDDFWLRLVCTNGLVLPVGGRRLLYRTHRPVDDDVLTATLVVALGKLPERIETARVALLHAKGTGVAHPMDAIEAILEEPRIHRRFVTRAQEIAAEDQARSRFDVVQAITQAAQVAPPDTRFLMESLAGQYAAAS